MDTNIRPRPIVAYPDKPDTTITVGDYVRSFDFHGNSTCYFIGTVARIDLQQEVYVIDVGYRVWGGEKAEPVFTCPQIFPPLNGEPGIFGPLRGVQRVLEGEEL